MRFVKISVATVVLGFVLVFCVRMLPFDHWGLAIAVNFLFMAFFSYLSDIALYPLYSSRYFAARPFEKGGSIYRWCGVGLFALVLRWIGWELALRKDQPISRDLTRLSNYESGTRGSEAVHLCSAVAVAGFTLWAGWHTSIHDVQWLVLVNILVNVYPVMLQRYNRPRVARVIDAMQRREDLSPGHVVARFAETRRDGKEVGQT